MGSKRLKTTLLVTLLVVGYAGVYFVQTMPPPRAIDTPLNWDMSGHLLETSRIYSALKDFDVSQYITELRVWSVYPPGYHAALAHWLILFGKGLWSISIFMWLTMAVCIAGIWIGFVARSEKFGVQAFVFTSLAVLATGQYMALAHMHMLDVPAAGIAVMSLGLLAWWYDRPTKIGAVLTTLAIVSTLLTKYNMGLPLLVSVGTLSVFALAARDWRRFWQICSVGLVSIGAWALFLTWQIHGWESFLAFSSNRSNSADWTVVKRALMYMSLYQKANFVPWGVSVVIASLALIGCRKFRSPFWIVCAAYVVSTLAAISNHSYFLDRNATSLFVVVPILAGFGVIAIVELLSRRNSRSATVFVSIGLVAVIALTQFDRGAIRKYYTKMFPENNNLLAPISSYVRQTMAEVDNCRVIGTFNNFSTPWAKLLWEQSRKESSRQKLTAEYDYPFESKRTGLDATDSSEYRDVVARELERGGEELLIALEPYLESIWWDGDYRLWSAWKRNYVKAISMSPLVIPLEVREFPGAQFRVSLFSSRLGPVVYGNGWGRSEYWGRWVMEKQATVIVPGADIARELVIVAATCESQTEPQECLVTFNGQQLGRLIIKGRPWDWHEYVLTIPASSHTGQDEISLQFSGSWPGSPTDTTIRVTPVQKIVFRRHNALTR